MSVHLSADGIVSGASAGMSSLSAIGWRITVASEALSAVGGGIGVVTLAG